MMSAGDDNVKRERQKETQSLQLLQLCLALALTLSLILSSSCTHGHKKRVMHQLIASGLSTVHVLLHHNFMQNLKH